MAEKHKKVPLTKLGFGKNKDVFSFNKMIKDNIVEMLGTTWFGGIWIILYKTNPEMVAEMSDRYQEAMVKRSYDRREGTGKE